MNGLSCKADGIAGGQALPSTPPRAHPLRLQSTPCSVRILCQVLRSYQLPNSSTCSYLFLCTPFASIHLVNKHLSHLIWCTREQQMLIQTMIAVPSSAQWRPPRSATPAFRRRQSLCGDYDRYSLALGGAHPWTTTHPPLNHDTLRRPNVSVRLKIFLLCCILGWERR